jgi:extracellular factor (EF) 3-hydroxypalmitic acid methyl ester biosynthesis protein
MSQALNGNGCAAGSVRKPVRTGPAPQVPETAVTFRTADGLERHATIVRTSLPTAHFEVYDPTLVLRLSEVLDAFQIHFQGRTAYSGRAVVRGLVDSGFKVSCEAKLNEDSWCGLSSLSAVCQTDGAPPAFADFLAEWQKLSRVQPAVKTTATDLLTFFTELQIWLNQVELSLRVQPTKAQDRLEREILLDLDPHFIRAITGITERFEHALNEMEPELRPLHQSYLRRFLHPLTQCSPFMHRAFEKPLGYAGDFEVVDMMFRDPFQGGTLFAKLLNSYALQLPPVAAHRNRIQYLTNMLANESLRARSRNRLAKVFNLGCGPAREVQRFMAGNSLSDHAGFVLADFEERTLKHTEGVLHDLKKNHYRKTQIKTSKISVAQLLKQHERRGRLEPAEQYDVVYCAGLFDYLTDTVCRQLMAVFYAMLRPGGLLVATNVDTHAAINQMECFLDWHLFYRNPARMRELAPAPAGHDEVVVKSDPTGANVFVEVRKPGL